jgi:hypothetical protein
VQLLDSVVKNHDAGLLVETINDVRLRDYQKNLDKSGKAQFTAVATIVASHSKMNSIQRASDVMRLYAEAQRSVEADHATLADAWYSMTKLRKAIEVTPKLSESDRRECLQVIDDKLVKRTLTSEMALCVAVDPRQNFGKDEPKLMEQAQKGLLLRLRRLYDLGLISAEEKAAAFEAWQLLRDSMDPTKKKHNVFTDEATRIECNKLGIFMWWKTHAPHFTSFVEYVVRPISGVRPSASNTERSNSMHKLLIGDKRAVIKNERAFKLLYIYQNARALDDASTYTGSDHALPELLHVNATIGKNCDDDPFAYCEDEGRVDVENMNDIVDTDDEEVQEVVNVMEGLDLYLGCDGIDDALDVVANDDFDATMGSESCDHDDEASTNSLHQSNDVEDALGGDDMTPGTKRRAEALNAEADGIDWRNEDGYFEQARPRATHAKTNLRRGGGQGRGRGRGRRSPELGNVAYPHASTSYRVELNAYEMERQRIMAENGLRLQQFQQDMNSMFASSGPPGFNILGNISGGSLHQQGGAPTSMQVQLSVGHTPSFPLHLDTPPALPDVDGI